VTELSALSTLDLWERAQDRTEVRRALVLAEAGGPPAEPEELERLPLGRRDARLLELYRALGGSSLEATAACPSCSETVEFEADAAALLEREARGAAPAALEFDGFTVEWRPPDSLDVEAAAAAADVESAERILLGRCVHSATGPDGPIEPADLPPEVRAAVAGAMAEADPLAEVLVDVSCPACGTGFVADLSVAAFVWAELRAAAVRVVREVDELARAYGWTELEVLALGERRRAAYLALVREASA
jgi:hypothetical protein